MEIKLLRNPQKSLGCPLSEGQSGEVDDSLGAELLRLGIANQIGQPSTIKAVPDPPAIATPQTYGISGDDEFDDTEGKSTSTESKKPKAKGASKSDG